MNTSHSPRIQDRGAPYLHENAGHRICDDMRTVCVAFAGMRHFKPTIYRYRRFHLFLLLFQKAFRLARNKMWTMQKKFCTIDLKRVFVLILSVATFSFLLSYQLGQRVLYIETEDTSTNTHDRIVLHEVSRAKIFGRSLNMHASSNEKLERKPTSLFSRLLQVGFDINLVLIFKKMHRVLSNDQKLVNQRQSPTFETKMGNSSNNY